MDRQFQKARAPILDSAVGHGVQLDGKGSEIDSLSGQPQCRTRCRGIVLLTMENTRTSTVTLFKAAQIRQDFPHVEIETVANKA